MVDVNEDDIKMLQALGYRIPESGLINKQLKSSLAAVTRRQKKELERTKEKLQVEIPLADDVSLIEDRLVPAKSCEDQEEMTESVEMNSEDNPVDTDPGDNPDRLSKEDAEVSTEDYKSSKKPTILMEKHIKKSISQDKNLTKVINWKLVGYKPSVEDIQANEELEIYKRLWDDLKVENGKLYYEKAIKHPILGNQIQRRIVIPSVLREDVMACLHQHPLSGHAGSSKTISLATKLVYWPKMNHDIIEAIKGCEACIKAKVRSQHKNVVLHQTSTAQHKRLSVFYTDIVGPWPTSSEKDYKYLLTFQDAVTKYPEAVPLKNITAETITKVIGEHLIARYGAGLTLISDRGTQFTSNILKSACKRLGIIKQEISSFHPQANPVERMHRSLEDIIRAFMFQENAHASEWYKFVPYALAALRQMPLTNLPASPHFLAYGQEPVSPTEVFLGEERPMTSFPAIEDMVTRFHKITDIIHQFQQENHERNKKYFDEKVKVQDLQPGDWIYMYSPGNAMRAGYSRKLMDYQSGPFKVLKVINDSTVRVQYGTQNARRILLHIGDVNRNRIIKVPARDISKLETPLSWSISKRKARNQENTDRSTDQPEQNPYPVIYFPSYGGSGVGLGQEKVNLSQDNANLSNQNFQQEQEVLQDQHEPFEAEEQEQGQEESVEDLDLSSPPRQLTSTPRHSVSFPNMEEESENLPNVVEIENISLPTTVTDTSMREEATVKRPREESPAPVESQPKKTRQEDTEDSSFWRKLDTNLFE
jgi:transposase InsO family protein